MTWMHSKPSELLHVVTLDLTYSIFLIITVVVRYLSVFDSASVSASNPTASDSASSSSSLFSWFPCWEMQHWSQLWLLAYLASLLPLPTMSTIAILHRVRPYLHSLCSGWDNWVLDQYSSNFLMHGLADCGSQWRINPSLVNSKAERVMVRLTPSLSNILPGTKKSSLGSCLAY